jgi:hypothetical protein
VEHRHHCLYCRVQWFCHEDCPLAGPSACEECRQKLRQSPDMPRRLIALRDSRVLDHLAEQEAQRIRQQLRRHDRP